MQQSLAVNCLVHSASHNHTQFFDSLVVFIVHIMHKISLERLLTIWT